MKKVLLIAIPFVALAVLVLLVVLLTGHVDLNLDVSVTGEVDKVEFYQTNQPDSPCQTILTKGKSFNTKITLNTAYQYYFIAYKGNDSFTSKEIGFSTRQTSAELRINALNEYTIQSID